MVKAKTTTYEEIRQQRLEENKKRMEELNLNKLAQSIRTTTSPKATPMKPRTPRTPMTDIEIRRSSRVANLPTPPVYKEGLPSIYCKENLPKNDDIITLVDENGNDWPTVWLARKNGLSGGWKAFAVDHDLVHGDTCIFELVEPTKFKVYIIRVNG
ncbi:hypothetical protein ACHQM5_022009 [Ranunculus cassubicifolius]